jgi:hypothetical protein
MTQSGAKKSSLGQKPERSKLLGGDTTGDIAKEPEKAGTAISSSAEASTASSKSILNDGKPTSADPNMPRLTREDEFDILKAQIVDCKAAGIEMRWVRIDGMAGLALYIPEAELCHHKKVHLGKTCSCDAV